MKINDKRFFLMLGWVSISLVVAMLNVGSKFSIGIFGQLVFGSCFIFSKYSKDKNFKLFIIPFMMLGLLWVLVSILSYVVEFDLSKASILLFFIGILFVGIELIIFPIKIYLHLIKVCTYEVSAPIIRYDEIRSGKSKFYYPVYSFRYNDKDCEIVSSSGYSYKNKEIGYVEIMKVNPNNLDEYFIERPTKYLLIPIMGIIFIVFAGIRIIEMI